MTALAQNLYENFPWRGYDDPSMPEAAWWGSVVVTGDASGGSMIAQIDFKLEGVPLSGDIFNLEELNASIGVSASRLGSLVAVGMGPRQGASFVDRLYSVVLKDSNPQLVIASLAGGKGGGDSMLNLPAMIGTVRGSPDDIGTLRLSMDNEGVGVALTMTAFGYRWGPRSMLAPNGPQRPVQSIFG